MAQSVAWFLFALSIVIPIAAQESSSAAPLDPGGDPSRLVRPVHVLLAEQYIWTAGDAATLRPDHAKFIYRDRDRKTEPHAFRGWFTLRRAILNRRSPRMSIARTRVQLCGSAGI
jgi:hypothetical protein